MAFVKSVDCRINRPHDDGKKDKSDIESGGNAGKNQLNQSIHTVLPDLMGSLYAYCLSLTKSVPDTEDLVQETCLKVLSSSGVGSSGMNKDINWEAYLIRIARNSWIDILRQRERLAYKLDSLKPLLHEMEEERRFEELESAVQLLVDKLPPWQRVIYVLRELMGYKAAETAEMLDTTEGAVKAALSRARSAIAEVRHRLERSDAELQYEAGAVEDNREELRSYLLAFRNGDTARIIDLCLNRTDDPMAVAGTILQQALPSPSMQPMMYRYSTSSMNSLSYGGGYTVNMVA
ncbi:RNA polymerase sigma factor [Paenibacillus amylolyticus]|uniref:RNA polymerase sigma factor n=1 Tax=Paenibacillus amylolyticus TaxID=1451 RepID=A0A100VI47_PAEAM|nr:RNA polymerase sigma factor [Paenibacillus amylolyticus]GAS80246.1 RNA polymerase sigma factor [Paenibacillus amylolyticus]